MGSPSPHKHLLPTYSGANVVGVSEEPQAHLYCFVSGDLLSQAKTPDVCLANNPPQHHKPPPPGGYSGPIPKILLPGLFCYSGTAPISTQVFTCACILSLHGVCPTYYPSHQDHLYPPRINLPNSVSYVKSVIIKSKPCCHIPGTNLASRRTPDTWPPLLEDGLHFTKTNRREAV